MWRTSFALLDLGIQEFRFGPRFVRRMISTNGFQIPPRISARFDWFHLAQNGSCILFHITRLIRFRGSVVREQNHRSCGSCLFTLFGTSSVAFSSQSKTRTDSSSSVRRCYRTPGVIQKRVSYVTNYDLKKFFSTSTNPDEEKM